MTCRLEITSTIISALGAGWFTGGDPRCTSHWRAKDRGQGAHARHSHHQFTIGDYDGKMEPRGYGDGRVILSRQEG
jgi:hypothetical protein